MSRADRYLTQLLGGMRGLPGKLGQTLRGRAGFEFSEQRIQPEPWPEIRAVLDSAWGAERLAAVFGAGEPAPAAVASLSQVYRARVEGREAAIKVQFIEIREAIERQLRVLGWLGQPLKFFGGAFSLESYREEFRRVIDEELDYRREVASIERARSTWIAREGIVVPEPCREWCGDKVIVTGWLDGLGVEDFAREADRQARERGAEILLNHFLESVFRDRWVHGDPHSGNFRFLPEGRVGVLDFGCMSEISENFCAALVGLVRQLRRGQPFDALPSFLALGFDPALLEPLRMQLSEVARVLLLPFLQTGLFSVEEWNLGERLKAALGAQRLAFRAAGPASLFLLIRVLHGLLQQQRQLGVRLPWASAFDRFAEGSTPQASAESVGQVLKLRVRVSEKGEMRVELALPAHLALDLASVIPDETLSRLPSEGIRIEVIQARFLNPSDLVPGPLFESRAGGRECRVWLE